MTVATEGPLNLRDLHSDYINFVTPSMSETCSATDIVEGLLSSLITLAALFDLAHIPASELVSSDAALPLMCSRESEG